MKARDRFPRPFLIFLLIATSGLCMAQTYKAERVRAIPGNAFGQEEASGSNCTPNGNRFNLEKLKGPQGGVGQFVATQFDESVAVLPNQGRNGADLVLGAAMDERALPPEGFFSGIPADAFYIQRDKSDCVANTEGELPGITAFGEVFEIFGNPTVVADPVHDAFFAADLRFEEAGDTSGVGLLKSSASTFLNSSLCPNGTQQGPATCWDSAQVVNNTVVNSFLFNPAIAVDQRTHGNGAGDVYVVVTQEDTTNEVFQVFLSACTNSLTSCTSAALVSGSDTHATFPWVQARADGNITVSYVETPTSNQEPIEIRFVNCKPGAPPTCSKPITVLTEKQPMFQTFPGDEQVRDDTYPRHVDRLEKDGKTVTTFLVYDRCEVPLNVFLVGTTSCPKTDVVVTSSSDDGQSWSPLQKVSSSDGQQFLGAVALDASTGTVNMAYYSTQNDPLKLRMQIFLTQIPPGQTEVSSPHQVTSAYYDGQIIGRGVPSNGDLYSYIGLDAAGTGKTGESHAYIHFTGSTAQGTFNGVKFPVTTNVLTSFQY